MNHVSQPSFQQAARRIVDLYGARTDAALREVGPKKTVTDTLDGEAALLRATEAHLGGVRRAGGFLLNDGRVRCGAIDLDSHGPNQVADPAKLAKAASAKLATLGVISFIEHTKTAPGTRVLAFTACVGPSRSHKTAHRDHPLRAIAIT